MLVVVSLRFRFSMSICTLLGFALVNITPLLAILSFPQGAAKTEKKIF